MELEKKRTNRNAAAKSNTRFDEKNRSDDLPKNIEQTKTDSSKKSISGSRNSIFTNEPKDRIEKHAHNDVKVSLINLKFYFECAIMELDHILQNMERTQQRKEEINKLEDE